MNTLNRISILISLLSLNVTYDAEAYNNIETKKIITNNTSHIVSSGESLFSIAEKYHIPLDNLQKWNNITNINQISLGQKIALKAKNKTTSLKSQAQLALTKKRYSLAIQLLTRLYRKGNDTDRQFALEFLGVAREKKGQKAFAKQAYQTFLKEYPKAKTAQRVKIRLNNLIGIETLTKNRQLRKGRKNHLKSFRSYTRGSLSSDYRKSISMDNSGKSRDTLSLANVDVDARGSYQHNNYNVGFKVSLGHYKDFLPRARNTSDRIRYLSFSAKSNDEKYQLKIGRQRSRGKGIFGRFDGVVLSSQYTTDIKINVVTGFPVLSSKITRLDKERKFYGLSVDIDNSWKNINFSLFIFNQTINGLTDRRAIGGQFNYYQNSTSLYGLIDYDIFFNKLNALLLSGSYSTVSKQRYSWSFNYRKSPYISTRNALIGQSADSFAALQNLFITDAEILNLAINRTLTSKTASLQFFQPLNKTYDVSTSFTWMDLSGAPGSGGVPAISQSGNQYYGNVYLSARKLYSKKDINQIGFRYSNLANSTVSSFYTSSQYRFNNGFSIISKLRFDTRSNTNGSSQQNISPTFRLQYQSKKHYLYSDLGAILYNSKSTRLPAQKTKIYYLYLGYRYYF